jgi:hypothetical protein
MLLTHPEPLTKLEATLGTKSYEAMCQALAQTILFGNPDQEHGAVTKKSVDYIKSNFGVDFEQKFGPQIHEAKKTVIQAQDWYDHPEIRINSLELEIDKWRMILNEQQQILLTTTQDKVLTYLGSWNQTSGELVQFTYTNLSNNQVYKLHYQALSLSQFTRQVAKAIAIVTSLNADVDLIWSNYKQSMRIIDLAQNEITGATFTIAKIQSDLEFLKTEWKGYSIPSRAGCIMTANYDNDMLTTLTKVIKARKDVPQLVAQFLA